MTVQQSIQHLVVPYAFRYVTVPVLHLVFRQMNISVWNLGVSQVKLGCEKHVAVQIRAEMVRDYV